MEKDKEQIKIMENGILYLGEDQGYWNSLKDAFSNFKQIAFNYELRYEKDPSKIQNFLKFIFDHKPKVVFFDLTKNTHEMLHTMRVLLRTNFNIKPFIISLIDLNQKSSVLQQAVMAGSSCIHIKSAEVEVVVFDAMLFAFNNAVEDHGFATANLNDDASIFIPGKLSEINANGIRIESNFSINPNDKYLLHSFWSKETIIKSPLVKAVTQKSDQLFYNYKYSQEFNFEFAAYPEDEDEKAIENYKNEIETSKKQINDWIEANQSKSNPKLIKCLIIDKELSFYIDQPLTDEYDYILRCQPFIVKAKEELIKLMPHMIIYQMEEVSEEEREANTENPHIFNDNQNLQYLLKVIKSINNYNPFIVVFNCQFDTNKLQKNLNYNQMISHSKELSTEVVLQMANILEKKLFPNKYEANRAHIILDKKTPQTYIEIEQVINIIGCSENDIYFNCDYEFENEEILRLDYPAKMYVTIAPAPKFAKHQSKYYGLVNGIGETELKEYRQFINSVFFREKMAKREEEAKEFENKKSEFIKKQKEEEEKRKKAEEERIAQEKAQKEKEENEKKKSFD